ncbi:MAG: YqhA family protein [Haloarculaceae archaeon]
MAGETGDPEDELSGTVGSGDRAAGTASDEDELGRSGVLIEDEKRSDLELWLAEHFEPPFFKLRFILIVPILISMIGAVMMFAVGTHQIYKAATAILLKTDFSNTGVTLPIIKALDAFLIGIILIIFSFGIYDFFVSILEPAEHAGLRPDWFKFETTGELKTKMVELVLVILAILFFEQIIANVSSFEDPILFLIIPTGAAILAFSIGFFKWATH